MRFRIGLALCLSLILISTTVWLRSHGNKSAPTLIAVDNPQENFLGDIASNTSTSTSNLSAPDVNENLTTTDYIGRQLITDYINLAQAGQATDQTLASLGSKYADGLDKLSTQAPTIGASDIQTVPDTKTNFITYNNTTAAIEEERVGTINQVDSSSQNYDTLDSQSYLLAKTIGDAYYKAANKLVKVKVPISIASLHIKLINNYLATGAGMRSVAQTESDSATAMAGIINASKSFDEEEGLIKEIGMIIKNAL